MSNFPIECPNCGGAFELSMAESLEPYSITLKLCVDKGRMASTKTICGAINNLTSTLQSAGDLCGHKTEVYLTGASVDEDMNVTITVSAVPIRMQSDDRSAA